MADTAMTILGVSVLTIGIGGVAIYHLFRGREDRGRITCAIEKRGGRVEGIERLLFGSAWATEQGHERSYRIRYRDSAGDLRELVCKTAMFGGVWFGEDRIIEYAASSKSSNSADVARENARLRAELEQLRRERGR